jgi:hypothetical protein
VTRFSQLPFVGNVAHVRIGSCFKSLNTLKISPACRQYTFFADLGVPQHKFFADKCPLMSWSLLSSASGYSTRNSVSIGVPTHLKRNEATIAYSFQIILSCGTWCLLVIIFTHEVLTNMWYRKCAVSTAFFAVCSKRFMHAHFVTGNETSSSNETTTPATIVSPASE